MQSFRNCRPEHHRCASVASAAGAGPSTLMGFEVRPQREVNDREEGDEVGHVRRVEIDQALTGVRVDRQFPTGYIDRSPELAWSMVGQPEEPVRQGQLPARVQGTLL